MLGDETTVPPRELVARDDDLEIRKGCYFMQIEFLLPHGGIHLADCRVTRLKRLSGG
jgi:hypothetical protein